MSIMAYVCCHTLSGKLLVIVWYCWTICKNKTKRSAVDEPPPDQEQAPLIVPVTTVSVNDFVADSMYADRILNPDEYNKQ